MKYRIVIRHQAEKELGRLGHDDQERIGKKLLLLENDPFPAGVIACKVDEDIAFASVIIEFSTNWMNLQKS